MKAGRPPLQLWHGSRSISPGPPAGTAGSGGRWQTCKWRDRGREEDISCARIEHTGSFWHSLGMNLYRWRWNDSREVEPRAHRKMGSLTTPLSSHTAPLAAGPGCRRYGDAACSKPLSWHDRWAAMLSVQHLLNQPLRLRCAPRAAASQPAPLMWAPRGHPSTPRTAWPLPVGPCHRWWRSVSPNSITSQAVTQNKDYTFVRQCQACTNRYHALNQLTINNHLVQRNRENL